MISFNNIGYMGRLGNQMFQYASLKGIASHKGYWYSIPEHDSFDIVNCFKIPPTLPNKNTKTVEPDNTKFDRHFFDNCPDDVDIVGYFQTEKYFKHIEKDIRRDFTFHDKIVEFCLKHKEKFFSNTPIVSLHIRRTDYLTDSNFESLSLNYYLNALKILPKFPVIVFSDDIQWCKENFADDIFTFSSFDNQYLDLCLMTMCDYHVIANSSFSWWGSWLAKSKQTIAPRKWFTGSYSHWNTSDLYLPEWIVL